MELTTATPIFPVFLIGVSIILALLAKIAFKKFKIPDVLVLILFGILLKLLGLAGNIDRESGFLKVLVTLALLYVVFAGALPIRIKALFSSAQWAFLSALMNFTVITFIIGVISFLAGFGLGESIALGMLMCVMDGSVINSILESVKFSKLGEAFVQFESAIIDIFVIVGIVAMLNLKELSLQALSQQFVNFILLSSAIGITLGIIWGLLLKRFSWMEHLSLTTMAILLLVYSFAEYFQSNGVIAVFFFAITLSNIKELSHIFYKKQADKVTTITRDQRVFFSDLSFLLRGLLFVFMGTLISFQHPWYIMLGALLTLVAYIARSLLFGVVAKGNIEEKEMSMIEVMAVKGLTPVVLLSLMNNSESFTNVVLGSILFSVMLTSLLIALINKGWFVSFRNELNKLLLLAFKHRRNHL